MSFENVRNFEALLPVNPEDITRLPDLSARVRQDAKYTRPKLSSLPHQVLLAPPIMELGAPTGYDLKKMWRLGKDRSRHEVHFGNLTFESSGTSTEIPVAIKDCILSWGLGEIAMNQLVAREGLYAFEPLSLFVGDRNEKGELVAYLVTARDEEITSLDSLDWPEMDEANMELVVLDAARAIAKVHAKGLFHGDLDDHFKNFVQRTTGEIAIVDWEHAVGAEEIMATVSLENTFGGDAGIARGQTERLSRRDFRDLKRSLDSLPFVRGRSEGRKLRIARKLLFDPYVSYMEDSSGHYSNLLTEMAKKAHSVLRAELQE